MATNFSGHMDAEREHGNDTREVIRAALRGETPPERERPQHLQNEDVAKPKEDDQARYERLADKTEHMSKEEYRRHFPMDSGTDRVSRRRRYRDKKRRQAIAEAVGTLKQPDGMPDVEQVREDYGRIALAQQKTAEHKEHEIITDRHKDLDKRKHPNARQSVELGMATEKYAPPKDQVALSLSRQRQRDNEIAHVRTLPHANNPVIQGDMKFLLDQNNLRQLPRHIQQRILKGNNFWKNAYELAIETRRQRGELPLVG